MTNSIKITAKQNHLITKLVEACDSREANGLVKFDIYDMGSFYVRAFLTIQREVLSFCTSDDNALLTAIYHRHVNNNYTYTS